MPKQNSRTTAPDSLIVIFGASGDLTKRKLIPALFHLYINGLMPDNFAVMGVSRTKYSDQEFREYLEKYAREFVKDFDQGKWDEFSPKLHYHPGDATKPDEFIGIKQRIDKVSKGHNTGENVLFYLSVSPRLYDPTIVNIGTHGMVMEGKAWCSLDRSNRPWQRIIVEKPFGHDVESAAHLNRVIGRVFEDDDVFRIDHYLGKETVQNLMVFRFANAIFEPIWNRRYIDHVQITAAETVGLEGRGGYYDSSDGGAMRDMIQSHLLQVMALVAMEPPVTFCADNIRSETTKVLNAVRHINPHDVPSMSARGQYGPGYDKQATGFLEEKGVSKNSSTETYAALKVFIDSWRWQGIPFYLRSGKRMPRKNTEIVVYFKPPPHELFNQPENISANQIVISVQPDEGIHLRFEGKVPGIGMEIKSVEMDFEYAEQFNTTAPDAYSTLLLDAMRGDQTLFKQREEIEQAWRIVQPILDYWQEDGSANIPSYHSGTWGPAQADELLAHDGHIWHNQ